MRLQRVTSLPRRWGHLALTKLLLVEGQNNGAEDSEDTEDELRRWHWGWGVRVGQALGRGDLDCILFPHPSWLPQGG